MAIRYHISAGGTPSRCRAASVDSCPKTQAGDKFHGTLEEATLESAQRFAASYGELPEAESREDRADPTVVAILEDLISATDPAESMARGEGMLESDFVAAQSELKAITQAANEASRARNYAAEIPLPEGYRELSAEEKKSWVRSTRSQTTDGKAKIALLERLYSKYPHPSVRTMLQYHRGESDEWPVSYNVGFDEAGLLAHIPQYSQEHLAKNQRMLDLLRNNGANFSLRGMDPERTKSLRETLQSKGLEIESVAAVRVAHEQVERQDRFANSQKIPEDTGREFLFHGTRGENIAGLLSEGFKQEEGVYRSGAASGEGFYFSSDPSVASAFGRVGESQSGYLVLCEVVTGGPERTQEVSLQTDYIGRGSGDMAPKTLGRKEGRANLARRTIVNAALQDEPYEETFVKNADQILPVAIIKVRGSSRKIL